MGAMPSSFAMRYREIIMPRAFIAKPIPSLDGGTPSSGQASPLIQIAFSWSVPTTLAAVVAQQGPQVSVKQRASLGALFFLK